MIYCFHFIGVYKKFGHDLGLSFNIITTQSVFIKPQKNTMLLLRGIDNNNKIAINSQRM